MITQKKNSENEYCFCVFAWNSRILEIVCRSASFLSSRLWNKNKTMNSCYNDQVNVIVALFKTGVGYCEGFIAEKGKPSNHTALNCYSQLYIAKFHFLVCATEKFKYFERGYAMKKEMWLCRGTFKGLFKLTVLCLSTPIANTI